MRSRSSSKSSIVELTDNLLLLGTGNGNSSSACGSCPSSPSKHAAHDHTQHPHPSLSPPRKIHGCGDDDNCIEGGFPAVEGGGDEGPDAASMREEILRLRRRIAALERTNERLVALTSSSKSAPHDEDIGEVKVHDGTAGVGNGGVTFFENLRDRSSWLVGLLVFQSCSGFILARNDALLTSHPVIVHFLTMLVGAGGNAGNQASVRVIRGLAVGTLNDRTIRPFLRREARMALALTVILSVAGFVRAAFLSGTPPPETAAVTASLALIVLMSVCLGAVLPLFLRGMGFDPAHSSTTIQVVMDILGVLLTVRVSAVVLGGL